MTKNRYRHLELRVGLLLLGVFALYAGRNARQLVAGPELSVDSPGDQAVVATTSPLLVVSGTAKRGISELRVGGAQSFVDSDGHFAETFLLTPGENRFTVEASDRFGRTVRVARTVWLVGAAPAPAVALASPSIAAPRL